MENYVMKEMIDGRMKGDLKGKNVREKKGEIVIIDILKKV